MRREPAGKLATIRGTVVRMGAIRPLIVDMQFRWAARLPQAKHAAPGRTGLLSTC
jgi:hypothetical protein